MTTAAEIAAAVSGKPSGSGWIGRCPCHNDDQPSLSISEAADGRILLHCHARCSQERLMEWARSHGFDLNGRKPARRIVATYSYCDETGTLRYQVVRWHPKDFRQRRPDGKGGWIDNMQGVEPLPYQLPQMLAAPDKIVFIVEGEKDADRLAQEGLIATSSHGGAKKWRPELCRWFKDRNVVILPDNDEPGRDHAEDVAKKLHGTARRVRILELPGLPPKGDVSDWLDAGHASAELQRLADAAPDWQTASDSSTKPHEPGDDGEPNRDEEEIARLAQMSEIEYERARNEAAKRLGMRVSKLDQLIDAKRAEMRSHDDPAFADTEPFDGMVDGVELIDAISAAIRSYVVIESVQADAMALWAVYTHAFTAFEIAPKLIFSSAEMRSGKTRACEVLQRLTNRSMLMSGINANTLLRLIDKFTPTLLLDEFDALVKGNAELGEALRGILNSGFTRGAAVYFKNVPSPGGGWEPKSFSTWCPQLIAGIGRVPETVADRSITIRMKRKLKGETIKRLRQRDGDDLRLLAKKSAAWAAGASLILSNADPKTPERLNDRAADAWSPLLTIADAAGGDWPARARRVAVALSGDNNDDAAENAAIMLLSDLRDLFLKEKVEYLSSADVVDHLVKLSERPWPEFRHGKPLTQNALAKLLKPFGIQTSQKWIGITRRNIKAYWLSDCVDTFARYLPPETTARPLDPDETTEGDQQSQAASGLADENPPSGSSSGCKTENDQQSQASSGSNGSNRGKWGARTYAQLCEQDARVQRVIAAKWKSRTPRMQREQRQ